MSHEVLVEMEPHLVVEDKDGNTVASWVPASYVCSCGATWKVDEEPPEGHGGGE